MPHFVINHGPSGPLIDIYVALSAPRLEMPAEADPAQPEPKPVGVKALVDTGASHTSIDVSLVKLLGLVPSGIASVITPTTGNVPCDVPCYDVAFHIPFPNGHFHSFSLWVASAMELQHQGFSVLLGRDILASGMLVYDGVHSMFILSF
jgi:hypothetical protein